MDGFEMDGKRFCLRGMTCAKKAGLRTGAKELWEDERGQATTEYAIIVGVLVVIAIVAIVAFRGRIAELWQAITDGINSL